MPALKRAPSSDLSTSASGSEDNASSSDWQPGEEQQKVPTTPSKSKARKTAASTTSTPGRSLKSEKQGDEGPATPKASSKKELPSSKDFGPDHQVQLNLAIRDLWSSSSGSIIDSYPALAPYKAKGRIHRHFHALLNSAPGGPEALKLFEASKKNNAPSSSAPGSPKTPKKAKKEVGGME